MAIALKRTSDPKDTHINLMVYAQSGSGKTYAVRTLPKPIIISTEKGLLSLADIDLPYIEVNNFDDLADAYKWLSESDEADQYETIALDSISDIAEVVLAAEKSKVKDMRQAYGQLQDTMSNLVRSFRDLPKHVYMTAKAEKTQDENGKLLWSPSMPGNKLAQSLPYFFDEVLALRVEKDEDGNIMRMLQCASDGQWVAKDRSGVLSDFREVDLGSIIDDIRSGNKAKED